MKRIKNIKETKALIKRYNTITLEEIKGAKGSLGDYDPLRATVLTGFGVTSRCTLCQPCITKRMGFQAIECGTCIHSIGFNHCTIMLCPLRSRFCNGSLLQWEGGDAPLEQVVEGKFLIREIIGSFNSDPGFPNRYDSCDDNRTICRK